MRLFGHWIGQWRSLPADERSVRVAAVLDRLARRDPRIRALGLIPSPPSWSRMRRELSVPLERLPTLLREDDPRRGPLFDALAPRVETIARRRPEHVRRVVEQARRVLDNRFDLLGHPVAVREDGGLDWHRDPTSDEVWPAAPYYMDVVTVRGDGSDVKYPWELSRCQHLLALAQTWRFGRAPSTDAALVELGSRCAARIAVDLRDWLRANPPAVGVNWSCTMEVGIRAYVWIATIALLRDAPVLDDDLLRELVRSLLTHGRHIRANLELGEGGLTSNHYLSDVVGLFAIACALPELRESPEWHRFARHSIEREITRQVYDDGVDFERSIPYHRLVTELFLHAALLARHSGRPFSDAFASRLSRMLEFVGAYTRPDGTAPQWGDNDDGRLLPLDGWAAAMPHDHRHLFAIGDPALGRDDLGPRSAECDVEGLWLGGAGARDTVEPARPVPRAFDEAAAYVLAAEGVHVFVGCGPVGTCGVGNHTHNDLLAPVIWADGVEWVTDPGSGSYTGRPELRDRLRATAAHATLQLGRCEQNALGRGLDGLFRVDERARPEVLAWEPDGARVVLHARHHGFAGDDAAWIHERRFTLDPDTGTLRIEDRLQRLSDGDETGEQVALRFPLGPGVEAAEPGAVLAAEDEHVFGETLATGRERHAVALTHRAGRAARMLFESTAGAVVEQVATDFSPAYGVVTTGRALELRLAGVREGVDVISVFRRSPD